MKEQNEPGAWLEKDNGERVPLLRNISFGRSTSNQVVLRNEQVSRRHALVHVQDENQHWLVDLGSSNGTYLNERRVTQPMKLQDEDFIQIGDFRFVFRQPSVAPELSLLGSLAMSGTIMSIKSLPCWLLVADIEDSTALARRLPQERLPVVTGQWFSQCKHILEQSDGTINKYLGDGFLAYWPETPDALTSVVQALREFRALQANADPAFRLALHHGAVLMGGVASMGEECLMGNDINFVFRMEKLCGSLCKPSLLSESAHARLSGQFESIPCGSHPLPGFEGDFSFHTF